MITSWNWSVPDAEAHGFPIEVVNGVDGMTKRKGERYEESVRRAINTSPYSKIVKWWDIKDNSDPVRLFKLPTETRERLESKYSRGKQEFIR